MAGEGDKHSLTAMREDGAIWTSMTAMNKQRCVHMRISPTWLQRRLCGLRKVVCGLGDSSATSVAPSCTRPYAPHRHLMILHMLLP